MNHLNKATVNLFISIFEPFFIDLFTLNNTPLNAYRQETGALLQRPTTPILKLAAPSSEFNKRSTLQLRFLEKKNAYLF